MPKFLIKEWYQTPQGTVVDVEDYSEISMQKLKVALDAGHGGTDPGAVNGSYLEKIAAMAIIETIQVGMIERGWEVLLTRKNDTFVGITERANMANNWGADVFISVHLNSAESKSANGVETLRYPTNNVKTVRLADAIQKQLVKATGFTNRGVKERADLGVLRLTRMPAALCEVGFISNDEEAKLLFQKDYQAAIAAAIIQGVEDAHV